MDEMNRFLAQVERVSGPDQDLRAVVCMDADGTLWDGDSGALFLRWLTDQEVLPDEVRRQHAALLLTDPAAACEYETRCMAGMKEKDVREYASYFMERRWRARVRPEMAALVASLERLGAEVFVLSGSNRWLIEEAASYVRLDRAHVIGMAVRVQHGVLTDQLDGPRIIGEGKLEAVRRFIGHDPQFAVGSSVDDSPLLDAATVGAAIISSAGEGRPLEPALEARARERGWSRIDIERRPHGT